MIQLILRWLLPPSRRSRIISTIFRVIFVTLFLGVIPVSSQADPAWLDSPTNPRHTCGAAWAEYNPYGNQKFHNAKDFCGGYRGAPVLAVADGIVVYVDWWPKWTEEYQVGHGKTIGVWHPKSRIYTYYTHLQEYKVSVGQTVTKGETVGLEGSSGKASGPHVHFVTAIMDPTRMDTPANCPQPYCFPNPDEFLGKDVVAQDIGLTTISPTGEVFKPAEGVSLYSGGKPIDTQYISFVETSMSTVIPAPPAVDYAIYSIEDFSFEEFDEFKEEDFVETPQPTEASSGITIARNGYAGITSTPPSNWETPVKWLLGGLVLFFLLGMIFSKPFRTGAIPVVLCTLLVLLLAIFLWPFIVP